MLADPKSQTLVDVFFAEWMSLVNFADADNAEYAYLDATLRKDMLEETKQLFWNNFVKQDNDLRTLLTTKTSYLNNTLANHYGLSGPSDAAFVETQTEAGRPGILGHASILSATSKEHETQPVARGKWVLDELLCESPRTPPPDVTALPETPDPSMTLKQQLAAHRTNAACAACHETMDPIGFGFEEFNEQGLYRTMYESGHSVDSSGVLPDGQAFNGTEELSVILNSDPRYLNCVSEKFFSYARGALAGPRDSCRVKNITETADQSQFSVRALIKAIVQNPAFLTRRARQEGEGS